eukprot:761731-Hanusia_phi.AAC.3
MSAPKPKKVCICFVVTANVPCYTLFFCLLAAAASETKNRQRVFALQANRAIMLSSMKCSWYITQGLLIFAAVSVYCSLDADEKDSSSISSRLMEKKAKRAQNQRSLPRSSHPRSASAAIRPPARRRSPSAMGYEQTGRSSQSMVESRQGGRKQMSPALKKRRSRKLSHERDRHTASSHPSSLKLRENAQALMVKSNQCHRKSSDENLRPVKMRSRGSAIIWLVSFMVTESLQHWMALTTA